MDGFNVSNSQRALNIGNVESQRTMGVQSPLAAGDLERKSFSDTLKDALQEVNQLQKVSDQKMQDLATGKTDNIPEVMIAAEKADIALKLMVQVRSKIIDAYQEVMKMQV
jgi:flagellar hook-basal body complex protein FliE